MSADPGAGERRRLNQNEVPFSLDEIRSSPPMHWIRLKQTFSPRPMPSQPLDSFRDSSSCSRRARTGSRPPASGRLRSCLASSGVLGIGICQYFWKPRVTDCTSIPQPVSDTMNMYVSFVFVIVSLTSPALVAFTAFFTRWASTRRRSLPSASTSSGIGQPSLPTSTIRCTPDVEGKENSTAAITDEIISLRFTGVSHEMTVRPYSNLDASDASSRMVIRTSA
mmetsp:Transcript_19842/g.46342  ORF Transcript_19842/g.46342 Transcript_19842/m.46342 type:complete len:223 (+) Transcript_19842:590-1258(+)